METIKNKFQDSSKKWRKWHSIVFLAIAIFLLFPIFRNSLSFFSDSWNDLQVSITFKRLIDILFLTPFAILPDNLTIIALILYLPFKLDKTRLSSAVLITILSLNLIARILMIVTNLGESTLNFESFINYSLIPFIAPILVLLLVTVFSFKWFTQPFVSGNGVISKNIIVKIIQSPYWLFNRASNFSFKQKNSLVSLATNVILFIAIGKLVAFCIFGFVWILLPVIAYMLLWALIIAVALVLVYYIFLRDNSSKTTYVVEDTSCPFAGSILVNEVTDVIGFKWPAKETIFTIDSDWKVKSKGKDFGWIDLNGQIRQGFGGDPKATLSPEPIVGFIKGKIFYIEGKKIGELVKV
jgi:membrane protein implicated in regulation of membrane protease activity